MPIRFRCPHCSRLLGIARRKSGSQINCPQCSQRLTVPTDDGEADLDEIDVLLNPVSTSATALPRVSRPEPLRPEPVPIPLPPPLPVQNIEPERPRTASPSTPQSQSRPVTGPRPSVRRESALLENDVDVLLGLNKPGTKFELDEAPKAKKQPVAGMDALSLNEDQTGLTLTPQKATLLGIGVLVLLGIAFAAGFIIASNT